MFFKKLSLEMIDGSDEIQEWLGQFESKKIIVAKKLLLNLLFVSRDKYSAWIKKQLERLSYSETYAIYAVRKLELNEAYFSDESGEAQARPSGSQGSEDLVNNVIANVIKGRGDMLDHPGIEVLRKKKIKSIVLIDDSIGSGNRVIEFINAMLKHRTFRSWWSFGWLEIKVLSFARNIANDTKILRCIRGGQKVKAKISNKDKICFSSAYIYNSKSDILWWGESQKEIKSLCEEITAVRSNYRLGYKKTFSNIIFYHSVPNNIPGVLIFECQRWKSLLPHRRMPSWLEELLDGISKPTLDFESNLSRELRDLLELIDSGVKLNSSLSLRLGLDEQYLQALLQQARKLGLVTEERKMTRYAKNLLHKVRKSSKILDIYNYGLYIPRSWCAD